MKNWVFTLLFIPFVIVVAIVWIAALIYDKCRKLK